MYTEVFASRLKNAREYNGYTQREVAKTLKIHHSTYAGYETGIRQPSLELVAAMSKIYCVTTDWLLGLTSESNINAIKQVIDERNREKILKQLDKELEMSKRAWG